MDSTVSFDNWFHSFGLFKYLANADGTERDAKGGKKTSVVISVVENTPMLTARQWRLFRHKPDSTIASVSLIRRVPHCQSTFTVYLQCRSSTQVDLENVKGINEHDWLPSSLEKNHLQSNENSTV